MVAHIKSKVVVVGGGGGQLSFRWLISDEANPSCNKKTKESVEMKKNLIPKQESNSRPSIYPMDV